MSTLYVTQKHFHVYFCFMCASGVQENCVTTYWICTLLIENFLDNVSRKNINLYSIHQ